MFIKPQPVIWQGVSPVDAICQADLLHCRNSTRAGRARCSCPLHTRAQQDSARPCKRIAVAKEMLLPQKSALYVKRTQSHRAAELHGQLSQWSINVRSVDTGYHSMNSRKCHPMFGDWQRTWSMCTFVVSHASFGICQVAISHRQFMFNIQDRRKLTVSARRLADAAGCLQFGNQTCTRNVRGALVDSA